LKIFKRSKKGEFIMNDKMKNKTKEQLVAMIEDLENQVSELKIKRARNVKKYRLINGKVDKKLPKQELALIANAPEDEEFTGVDLENFAKDSGDLVTRQPEGRIFAWYRAAMVDGGYIEAVKPAVN